MDLQKISQGEMSGKLQYCKRNGLLRSNAMDDERNYTRLYEFEGKFYRFSRTNNLMVLSVSDEYGIEIEAYYSEFNHAT